MRLGAVAIVLTIVLASGHASAWAQAGWYLTPSFQVTEVYDDNIFGRTSGQRSDFISRFSPGLQVGYRSDPLTLLVRGAFDAEVFAKNPQENDATSSKRAGMNLKYVPILPLTLGLDVAYTETKTLATLAPILTPAIPANALEFGRHQATVLTASPFATYQFTTLTSGTSEYSYTNTTLEGGTENTVHQGRLGLSHRFTPLDTGTVDYRLNAFEDSTSSTIHTSHALLLGWTRQLTPQTTISVQGGPRFSGDTVNPEIKALLAHEFTMLDLRPKASLGYSRSEGFVIGTAGSVQIESVTGSLGFNPLQLLQMSLDASVSRLSGATGSDTTLYGVTAGASYQLLRWLAVRASYRYSLQEQNTGDIRHNVFSLSLDASYPIRMDQ